MSDPGAYIATNCRPCGFDGVDEARWESAIDPDMPSLEALVDLDMRENGFDPKNAEETRTYWQTLLEPKQFKHRHSGIQPYFAMPIMNDRPDHAETAPQFDEMKNTNLYHKRAARAEIPGLELL